MFTSKKVKMALATALAVFLATLAKVLFDLSDVVYQSILGVLTTMFIALIVGHTTTDIAINKIKVSERLALDVALALKKK